MILLLAIMRQSLVSVIYLIVITWKIMFKSEDALKQRSENLQDDIESIEEDIKKLQSKRKNKITEFEK